MYVHKQVFLSTRWTTDSAWVIVIEIDPSSLSFANKLHALYICKYPYEKFGSDKTLWNKVRNHMKRVHDQSMLKSCGKFIKWKKTWTFWYGKLTSKLLWRIEWYDYRETHRNIGCSMSIVVVCSDSTLTLMMTDQIGKTYKVGKSWLDETGKSVGDDACLD